MSKLCINCKYMMRPSWIARLTGMAKFVKCRARDYVFGNGIYSERHCSTWNDKGTCPDYKESTDE